ncbi:MAG: metallophosphoesterase [Parcubacteria group bacterium LiPW_41]|nr:MAG: metallophosphoesterase [Parcubacteria group bacterium LiPW_41]
MRYIFIIILLFIQIILFGAHYVLYKGIIDLFAIKNGTALLSLRVILGVLSLSFIFASVIGSKFYNSFTQIFYTSAAVWLGILLYLFLATIIFFLLRLGVGNILSTQLTQLFGVILLLIGFGVGIYGVYNARTMQITEIRPTIKNIPEEWKGKSAVWVSDIHLGQVYSKSFSEKISEKIQSLNPDIVFLGGDVFDGTAENLSGAVAPLASIKSTHGTYFISGNHEEFSNDESFINAVRESGITVLKNESVSIGGMNIIGVDYRDSENKETFVETLKKLVKPEVPTILLKHAPTNLNIASDAGVNFQISGHTHVAQVFPFMYITRMVYGVYEYGLHPYNDMNVYTSSGVGTWGPPLRVGTKSEIVKIVF